MSHLQKMGLVVLCNGGIAGCSVESLPASPLPSGIVLLVIAFAAVLLVRTDPRRVDDRRFER